MNELGELMRDWRVCRDDMMEDTAELRAQIDALYAALREIEIPYEERLKEIEARIRLEAIAQGTGLKAHGVAVNYRSGYERVSYDSGQTDMVLGILRDVLPETANALEGARKSSWVQPSVAVKAID